MEHSIGYYLKIILKYAPPAIAFLGALILIASVVFHLTYLININSRAVFLMTLTDYLSLSFAMIPLILVPLVTAGLIGAPAIAAAHFSNWLESHTERSPSYAFAYFSLMVLFFVMALWTPWEASVIPFLPFLMAFLTLGLRRTKKPTARVKFLFLHGGLAILYLFFFFRLIYSDLRPLLAVATLVLNLESWAALGRIGDRILRYS